MKTGVEPSDRVCPTGPVFRWEGEISLPAGWVHLAQDKDSEGNDTGGQEEEQLKVEGPTLAKLTREIAEALEGEHVATIETKGGVFRQMEQQVQRP